MIVTKIGSMIEPNKLPPGLENSDLTGDEQFTETYCFYCNTPILRIRKHPRPACRECHSKGTPTRWRIDHPEEVMPQSATIKGTGLDIVRTQRQLVALRGRYDKQIADLREQTQKLTASIAALSIVTGIEDSGGDGD